MGQAKLFAEPVTVKKIFNAILAMAEGKSTALIAMGKEQIHVGNVLGQGGLINLIRNG